jgi:hypothetical protein
MIFSQLSQQFDSLSNLLELLTDDQYRYKVEHLAKASIGSHTRHIIELAQCMVDGYHKGEIDYVNRNRNLVLESNRVLAQNELISLTSKIRLSDKQLRIVVEESYEMETQEVFTTFFREVVYNTEHAVHHLALIRVALIEMKLDVVNANFGVANSTIKYKQSIENEQ